MPTTAMFLVCLMVAPQANGQQAEPLTNMDLLEINGNFAATSEFKDNEFLYDEKLTEVVQKSKSYEGRSVELVAEVEWVRRHGVKVTFFPNARYSWFHPMLAFDFANASSETPRQSSEASLVDSRSIEFEIGNHQVPISLAKTLREGDMLRISGELVEIRAARREVEDLQDVAGFVIASAKVEKISQGSDSK